MSNHVSTLFWAGSIAIIACYAFFVLLRAWDPLQVVPLTIAVAALGLMLVGYAWYCRRMGRARDPEEIRHRERRGF